MHFNFKSLYDNREWIFSGCGLLAVPALIQIIRWLTNARTDSELCIEIGFTLSHNFLANLMDENALPLDTYAIRGLQSSTMALDVYTWLAYRLCRIPENRHTTIPWTALQEQFGPQYTAGCKFRQDFKEALARVLILYQDARVELPHGGLLTLRRSPPPVAPTTLRGYVRAGKSTN